MITQILLLENIPKTAYLTITKFLVIKIHFVLNNKYAISREKSNSIVSHSSS